MSLLPLLLVPIIATSAPIGARSLDGKRVTIPAPGKVTCLVFVGTDCPIANRLVPELKRIVADSRSVVFYFVYPLATATKSEAAKHHRTFGLNAPGILDSKLALAKFAKASVTPEACVFDAKGRLAYHGRINDFFTEHSIARSEVSKNDLRDAIRCVLDSKPIAAPFIAPIGCPIPGA